MELDERSVYSDGSDEPEWSNQEQEGVKQEKRRKKANDDEEEEVLTSTAEVAGAPDDQSDPMDVDPVPFIAFVLVPFLFALFAASPDNNHYCVLSRPSYRPTKIGDAASSDPFAAYDSEFVEKMNELIEEMKKDIVKAKIMKQLRSGERPGILRRETPDEEKIARLKRTIMRFQKSILDSVCKIEELTRERLRNLQLTLEEIVQEERALKMSPSGPFPVLTLFHSNISTIFVTRIRSACSRVSNGVPAGDGRQSGSGACKGI